MTNNCILASAVEAEFLGFNTDVRSDATGAVNLANDVGFADAKTVHSTLLTLLNSSWATGSTTDAWAADALEAQQALPKSDLGSSAMAGAARLTARRPGQGRVTASEGRTIKYKGQPGTGASA